MTMSLAPFVGRASELDVFARSMPRSSGGTGRVIALAGEAGIGKTRLLAEVVEAARDGGKRVLWSQMIEAPRTQPYFPWLLALRSCVQQSSDDELVRELGSGAADIADIVPELRERITVENLQKSSNGTEARYRLFDSVTRYLLAAASRRPLVLLFDNLQSADRSSLSLLEYFCQQIAGSPILVVTAYRDSELGRRHPLRGALNTLSRTAGFLRLTLSGLSRPEVAELLYSQVESPLLPAFVEAVYNRSDGNPLFVTEVGGMLVRCGLDAQPAGDRFAFKVPENLREVIAARLDALSDETCELLGLAAVLGREFELAAVADLANIRVDRARRLLHHAEAAGIVDARASGRHVFNHALFREVLYEEHSTIARVKLHRRAGDQLEARCRDDMVKHLPDLAYHFFEASQTGVTDKAIRYCQQAAKVAASQRAHGEAVALLDCALQAAELESESEPELRYQVLQDLGQAQYRAGQLDAVTRTLMKAAIIAYRKHWWTRLAETLFLFQLACQQSGYRHVSSVPLHNAVLENLPEHEQGLRARVLASLAKAYRTAAEPERAAKVLRQSLRIAREHGEQGVLLDCLRKGNWIIGRNPMTVREGLDICREALKIAQSLGHEEAVIESTVDVIFQLCDLGEIDEVERQLALLRERVDVERHLHFATVLRGFETAVAILRGRWHDAIVGAREGVRLLPLQGVFGVGGRFGFQIFAIKRAHGTLDDVRDAAEEFISSRGNSPTWLPGQILLHCELGQCTQARRVLRQVGNLEHLPRDDLYEVALVYLSEACAMLNDKRTSKVLYELLLPYRGLNVTLPGTLMLGAASGYLAKLAVVSSRLDEARTLFEEALSLNRSMGAETAVASVQVDYARMLSMTACRNPAAGIIMAPCLHGSIKLNPSCGTSATGVMSGGSSFSGRRRGRILAPKATWIFWWSLKPLRISKTTSP